MISRGDSHSWFRVVIKEGRNREVRRMWESQGLMVSRLKRIRYGNVELPRGLLKGQSEPLDPDQVKVLRESVGAADVEPTLTLQPVIGQRRAPKSNNEFRPAPRTQQAWTGAFRRRPRIARLRSHSRRSSVATGRRSQARTETCRRSGPRQSAESRSARPAAAAA